MLTVYRRIDEHVRAVTLTADQPIPPSPLWIDLLSPSETEEAKVEAFVGIDVPTPEEMREIETTSRLYREGAGLFMTASVMNRGDTPEPETRATTFILVNRTLITVRYADPTPFRMFSTRLLSLPELSENAETVLVALLDTIIDRIADLLEGVDVAISELSKAIFAPLENPTKRPSDYHEELSRIGQNAIRCTKIDESLVGFARLLLFLDVNLRASGNKQARTRIKDLQRDIQSLSGYVERLSERFELLLDATLGLINIQQTNIIKLFSVVAVVFLPPTLIASIYGMNFEIMPELSWPFGYPLALVMMVVSAIAPYVFIKRQGWL
ncbi:MAG: magnesium transporter CorA family protein [Hyphomicrobiales bacterium]|nr:magnesium transporter CorA family protein [Hyphomicrobiales bacterium]